MKAKHAFGGTGSVLTMGYLFDYPLHYLGFHRVMCKYDVGEHPFSTDLNIHVVGKIARRLSLMLLAGHNNHARTCGYEKASRWTQQPCTYLILAGHNRHART